MMWSRSSRRVAAEVVEDALGERAFGGRPTCRPASSNGSCWMPVISMCLPAGARESSWTLWITNSIGNSSGISARLLRLPRGSRSARPRRRAAVSPRCWGPAPGSMPTKSRQPVERDVHARHRAAHVDPLDRGAELVRSSSPARRAGRGRCAADRRWRATARRAISSPASVHDRRPRRRPRPGPALDRGVGADRRPRARARGRRAPRRPRPCRRGGSRTGPCAR